MFKNKPRNIQTELIGVAVTFETRIREMPSSNLGRNAYCSEAFMVFLCPSTQVPE
jgi:hypothetical protein